MSKVEHFQMVRISRLQVALQRIKEAPDLEKAQALAQGYLSEDHDARNRQHEGNFKHPCED